LLAGDCLVEVGEVGVGQVMAQKVQKKLIQIIVDLEYDIVIRNQADSILGRTDTAIKLVDSFVLIRQAKNVVDIKIDELSFKGKDIVIGQYPVTNIQYRQFIDAGGYLDPSYWDQKGWMWRQEQAIFRPRYWQDARFNKPLNPVVGISWYEANAYCRWLSEKKKRNIRLPMEGEWMVVASGKEGRLYPWGNNFDLARLNSSNYWTEVIRTVPSSTTNVFQFPSGASSDSVFDLCGNVWEMTGSAAVGLVVACGGSWQENAKGINCMSRRLVEPTYQDKNLGFRVLPID
jgi:formylglycine-generating enzyme required for sulfatase activity